MAGDIFPVLSRNGECTIDAHPLQVRRRIQSPLLTVSRYPMLENQSYLPLNKT
jgi:hypothetical protein